MNECCCHKSKQRDEKEVKALVHRLNRIEGQIRGLVKMVENDAYCTDILTQTAAASAALAAFSRQILNTHIKTCVINDIKADKLETVDELTDILHKLMR